uniref:ATP-grasp fold succinyl-CoA synthetase-type domain-containing protein n=1 Tax=Biomphalaria glabrata TaxID=6526 RepID=A0A2C9L646_BIOGL
MHIHEYQAKKILKKYNVRVQDGVLVSSKKSIKSSLEKIKSFPVFIKAQVHAGGRKKSGAVQRAVSHKDAEQKLSEIIGMKIVNNQTGPEGKTVMKAYVESAIDIKSEFYISLVINRSLAKPMFIISKSGGTEIEALAKTDPDKIIKIPIDICIGVQDFHIRKILYVLGLSESNFDELKNLINGIYNAFMENDADQIEINPVALDNENKLIALDAKMNFDENAYYRQQNIFKLKDRSGYSKSEKLAEKYNLSFIKMDGSI